MRLGGALVQPGSSYRVAASQFLADGPILSEGRDRQSDSTEIDALVAHLGATQPFVTPETGRIVRLH